MALGARLGIVERAIPVLAPQDITTTATNSVFVSMKNAVHATFYVHFGSITAASADQAITVTLTAATSSATTSETAIAFNYRLSGAQATDTLGAITAATASGMAIATTDDNKVLLIDVDPRVLDATASDAAFVSVRVAPDAGASATLVSAICVVEQAYGQLTPLSAS